MAWGIQHRVAHIGGSMDYCRSLDSSSYVADVGEIFTKRYEILQYDCTILEIAAGY